MENIKKNGTKSKSVARLIHSPQIYHLYLQEENNMPEGSPVIASDDNQLYF